MFHSFVLKLQQCILVKIITELCKQNQLIDILLHVVNLLPLAEIVYIPHHWWHSLRLYDPSALLCGRVFILILFIRLVVTFIFN